MRGERLQLDWDSMTRVDGWRFGLPTATFQEVVNVIHAEMDSNEEESIKSTVKHVILLFCSTVLFAQRDHKACSCLFSYIDLGTIGDVAWAYLVHEFLVRSLNSHAALGGKGHILRCSIILQWIGEDTKKTKHRKLIDRVGDGMVKATEVLMMVEAMAREEALLFAQGGYHLRVKDIDISAFPIDEVVVRPIQDNSHDCGLFVLKEMEYLSRDASLDFTHKDITAMRTSLLSEMLNGVYGKVSM
ncbi:uncharacterized protein LOC143891250 [Tasmannia lanceolata]|uniref:uncharacterized protein LOC143891250 n=1 Tax=Tasmannia lanceolata TaxID=3420 RepID=UPI0040628606